jgi:hypothetical protein
MGVKKQARLLAVVIAVIMMMTSAASVFGASSDTKKRSTEQGSSNANLTYVHVDKGNIEVVSKKKCTYKIVNRKSGKKTGTVKANGTIKNLKKGERVVITNSNGGKTYRWIVQTKISQKKKGKITWTKIKGATRYAIFYTDNNGKKHYTHVSYKTNTFKVKKGWKVIVRPVRKVSGHSYVGQLSKMYKVKK